MHSLNIKERKLLELQTDTLLAFYREKCPRSRPPKMNVNKIESAHLQCISNHCAKFEYKGVKTLRVTEYTNQISPKHFGWKKCRKKYLSNVHKILNIKD